MSPAVMRGLSDAKGSWNTICIERRYGRSADLLSGAMSSPSSLIAPLVGSTSRSTVRATVDLPQPDSPTRPSVSPRVRCRPAGAARRRAPGSA
jgi:hypothetical protein